jgi:hypothetical protein
VIHDHQAEMIAAAAAIWDPNVAEELNGIVSSSHFYNFTLGNLYQHALGMKGHHGRIDRIRLHVPDVDMAVLAATSMNLGEFVNEYGPLLPIARTDGHVADRSAEIGQRIVNAHDARQLLMKLEDARFALENGAPLRSVRSYLHEITAPPTAMLQQERGSLV